MAPDPIPPTSQTVQDINTISSFLAHSQVPLQSLLRPATTPLPRPVPVAQPCRNPIIIILAGNAILHTAHSIFSFLQTQLHDQQEILPWFQQRVAEAMRDQDFSQSADDLLLYSPITTLLITGGIGHSTRHLRTAIANHLVYSALPELIKSSLSTSTTPYEKLSEARLLHYIFLHFYDGDNIKKSWNYNSTNWGVYGGLKVYVEGESTNCGANAWKSKAVMGQQGLILGGCVPVLTRPGGWNAEPECEWRLDPVSSRHSSWQRPSNLVIVQDPTMSLRTVMSFEKAFEEEVKAGIVKISGLPTFIPCVKLAGSKHGHGDSVEDHEVVDKKIVWDTEDVGMSHVDVEGLWDMKRFYGLLLGEVSRLRDDEAGYGPEGSGFIGHCDIPEDVESAWRRLKDVLEHER